MDQQADSKRTAEERLPHRILWFTHSPVFYGEWHATREQAQIEADGHAVQFFERILLETSGDFADIPEHPAIVPTATSAKKA
jgi:hypothetical protein